MEKLKELRDKTGAGISDCKKALDESSGDIEKAVEILRKKGISKAAKRSDKDASEGIILLGLNSSKSKGYLLQISSETDFVAKNEKFQKFSQDVLEIVKERDVDNLESLLSEEMNSRTVKEEVENLSGVIAEKIEITRLEVLTGAKVAVYSHMGGRIGVLVSFDKEVDDELATDIAMHVAASNPKYINPEDVSPQELDKEKEIYKEQLLTEGKPENIIDKILDGKVAKYYEEVCLSKQEFVKDDKKKIEEILGDAKVVNFVRHSL